MVVEVEVGASEKKVIIKPYRRESQGSTDWFVCVSVCACVCA